MRIDKSDCRVTCDGRDSLQGEVGKDRVKLPVYEIEKLLLLSGGRRLGRPIGRRRVGAAQ